MERVQINGNSVTLNDFTVDSKVISQHLLSLDEELRHEAITNALEVGIYSLQRAQTGQDLEFVRRQIDALLQDVQSRTASIPDDLKEQIIKKIGTEKGQALEPVARALQSVEENVSRQVRDVRQLLVDDIDPKSSESTLGRALLQIRHLLDPERTDSLQSSFTDAINNVSAADGAIASTLGEVILKELKPLREELDELGKEIRSQRDTREALNNTTAKGVVYEEELVARLQQWSARAGFTVEHVGADNKPGDILVTRLARPSIEPIQIIIEAKDKQSKDGRKPITRSLKRAMNEANADAGIFVNRDISGFANEIGDWAEGVEAEGEWIACTDEHLIAAIRMLVCKVELSRVREEQSVETDTSSILNHMQRIRTAIKRVGSINRHVTSVRTSAGSIQEEAALLRDEIRASLIDIEDALCVVSAGVVSSGVVSNEEPKIPAYSGDGAACVVAPELVQSAFL